MIIGAVIYAVAWIISLIVLARQDASDSSSKVINLYQCKCGHDGRVKGNIGILLLIVAFLPFTFVIGLTLARKVKVHKEGCLVKLVDDVK
jgi:hypothetical protein